MVDFLEILVQSEKHVQSQQNNVEINVNYNVQIVYQVFQFFHLQINE